MEKNNGLTLGGITNIKTTALHIAERLNPAESIFNAQCNNGLTATTSKVTADKVLKDAQQIYEWLIKE